MALSTVTQIQQMATDLQNAADAIHVRLMAAIQNNEIEQPAAQSLFQDEALLRQRSDSLYIQAIDSVVEGLQDSQASVMKVITDANTTIQNIEHIKAFIDLVADLLVLAAAVYAAKPGPILSALNEIKNDVAAQTA
ncbi:MAG: hypothetical protein JWQ69_1954 [Pseudomonas sp.]|nr:hypothetical protein [Pseudomonas sp.]